MCFCRQKPPEWLEVDRDSTTRYLLRRDGTRMAVPYFEGDPIHVEPRIPLRHHEPQWLIGLHSGPSESCPS